MLGKIKKSRATDGPEDVYDPEHGKAIIIKNVVKKFEDVTAVNDLSFEVKEGQIFG